MSAPITLQCAVGFPAAETVWAVNGDTLGENGLVRKLGQPMVGTLFNAS